MARVLFSSNAPWAGTGYGRQTAYILRGLRDLGHDVACLAWWGLEGGSITWEGIPIWPKHLDGFGNDAMFYRIKRWHPDLLITLIDLWVMDQNLANSCRFAPYFPIDHADPIPPNIAQRFAGAYRLLVYSRYAEREIAGYDGGRYKDRLRYIPHGCDCSLYRPAESPAERQALRRKFYPDWPEDGFVVGMVAANKGYPCRKSFPEALEAFARFYARHPNARLYLHSFAGPEFKGPDLGQWLGMFGLREVTRLANANMILSGDYSDQHMRDTYATFDVLLSPSQGEGFGLPILEAQSAGVPVIVTDHSAMAELCGAGWRVPPLRLTPSLIGGRFAEADVTGIEHALEECYRRPLSTVVAMQAAARAFALEYDWPKVIRDYWGPFLAEVDAGRQALTRQVWTERRGLAYPALSPVSPNGANGRAHVVPSTEHGACPVDTAPSAQWDRHKEAAVAPV